MTEPGDTKSAEHAALWRRFRTFDGRTVADTAALVSENAALELAAYAEGRLDAAVAERIEVWLATNPDALADLVVARTVRESAASERVIERAAALISGGARIIPFRRPAVRQGWRVHVAQVAVAASLAVTGLVGFTLSSEVYANLGQTSESVSSGLFDLPAGVFSTEDSTT